MKFRILNYTTALRADFERFNREWLEKYFVVEPIDEAIFKDPETTILKPGGCILFAEVDGQLAGTCALIRHPHGAWELAKMGVDLKFQGQGVGRALATAVLNEAQKRGATEVELVSNRKLKPALHLYETLGFREVPIEPAYLAKYARCDIKMVIDLNTRPC